MTRREMYEDLLERCYHTTIADAKGPTRNHYDRQKIYRLGLLSFSHPVSGVVARTWNPEKEKMVDDLFCCLYEETLGIISSPEMSAGDARDVLCDTLLTMGRFFNREEV